MGHSVIEWLGKVGASAMPCSLRSVVNNTSRYNLGKRNEKIDDITAMIADSVKVVSGNACYYRVSEMLVPKRVNTQSLNLRFDQKLGSQVGST